MSTDHQIPGPEPDPERTFGSAPEGGAAEQPRRGTDETPAGTPSEAASSTGPASESAATRAPSAADRVRAKLSIGEQMIALGALIIVVFVDFVGDVLIDDYVIGTELLWGTALAALLLIWLHRFAGSALFTAYDQLIIFLGFAGGVFGIRELLYGIDGGLPNGAGVIFGLAAYVGAGLMAYGATLMIRPG